MSDIEHLDKGKDILSKDRATNWELHDGAEDGYLDKEKDSTSDPEDNVPLSRTVTLNTNPDDIKQASKPLQKEKQSWEVIYIERCLTVKIGIHILI